MMVNVEMEQLPNEMLCTIAQEANETATEALSILVQRNEKLIYKIAHSLEAKGYTSHLFDFEDLCQAGRLAMIEAAKRYDPERDNKFSTYCWVYVSGIMRNEAMENSTVISASRETILRARNRQETEEDREAYRNTFEPLSLNAQVLDNEREEMIDRVRSEDTTNIFMTKQSTKDILRDVARALTENERFVLFEYFGIGEGNDPKTDEEVASKMHLTRQRVQQLRKSAIKKMAERMKDDGYEISDFM